MDFDSFYDYCQNKISKSSFKYLGEFCNTVAGVFSGDIPDFKRKENILSLFYGKGDMLSLAQYYRNKNFVLTFYRWLQDNDKIDPEFVTFIKSLKMEDVIQSREISTYYFRDLKDVLNYISLCGKIEGLGGEDDLLNIKSLAILSWHGVEIRDISEIKKDDIEENGVRVNGEVIVIEYENLKSIYRFSKIDEHQGFPSGKLQRYRSSPFLFRSQRQIQLNENNLWKVFDRFNSSAAGLGKKISAIALMKNGILYKASKIADDDNARQVLQELSKCDSSFSGGYYSLYKRWKEYYEEDL